MLPYAFDFFFYPVLDFFSCPHNWCFHHVYHLLREARPRGHPGRRLSGGERLPPHWPSQAAFVELYPLVGVVFFPDGEAHAAWLDGLVAEQKVLPALAVGV